MLNLNHFILYEQRIINKNLLSFLVNLEKNIQFYNESFLNLIRKKTSSERRYFFIVKKSKLLEMNNQNSKYYLI